MVMPPGMYDLYPNPYNNPSLKLRGCPVCGWRNTEIIKTVNGVTIRCRRCGFTSRTTRFIWTAKWNWNRTAKKLKRTRKSGRKYNLRGREW